MYMSHSRAAGRRARAGIGPGFGARHRPPASAAATGAAAAAGRLDRAPLGSRKCSESSEGLQEEEVFYFARAALS